MNAKYVVALLLAMQVSVCLCEGPTPSPEVIAKYNELRAKFLKRMALAFSKVQEAAAPSLERIRTEGNFPILRDTLQALQDSPRVQVAGKLAASGAEGMEPIVEAGRAKLLGLYQQWLRPYIGPQVVDGLNFISGQLDTILPVEE